MTHKHARKASAAKKLNQYTRTRANLNINKETTLPVTIKNTPDTERIIDNQLMRVIKVHPFSRYAKFSEKLTFLPLDTYTNVLVSGVKNVSFTENFAYVLNGWSLTTSETSQILKNDSKESFFEVKSQLLMFKEEMENDITKTI